jgi:2-dehydropantoate 2-reductase
MLPVMRRRSVASRARLVARETGTYRAAVAGEGPILIAGAGALGSVVGGLLAAAGWPVTLLGRRAHVEAARAHGLAIEGLFGTHRVRGLVTASDPAGLRGPYAAIFLTVKAYDTAAMAAAVAPHLAPDGFLLSLQNGLGNVEAAERAAGSARVLGARVIFGAEVVEPGRARVTVYADPVLVGSPDPGDRARRAAAGRWATALAAAGIPSEPTDALTAELWAKVLYNAALNPLGALLGLPYGDLPAHPDTRAIMDTVIEEAFAVARAEGVSMRWPDAGAYRETFYGRLVPATAEHRSSMLQDIERGRPTEIDAINGEIAARGARRGLPAPVNATLTRLIRARAGRGMESSRWSR